MYRLSGRGWWRIVACLMIQHEYGLAAKLALTLKRENYDEVVMDRIQL